MIKINFAILLLICGACIAEPVTEITDFAFKAELEPAESDLRRVSLPAELLKDLTRSDLGDVRVFDREGKPVPSWVRRQPVERRRESKSLNFYAFTRNQREPSTEETVTVTRDSKGRLEAYSRLATPPPQSEVISHYIIEHLQQDREAVSIDELWIDWSHKPAQRLLSVKVEASDDLNNWQLLRKNQSLTQRISDEDKPRGQAIKINSKKQYIKLSLNNPMDRFKIRSVQGYYNKTVEPQMRWYSEGELTRDPDDPAFLRIPAYPAVQPEGLRFQFSEPDQLLKGDIYSSAPGRSRRQLRRQGIVQHNIINNPEIEPNKPLKLYADNQTVWWFKPVHRIDKLPRIEFIMPNYELVFLASGVAPFDIAWGNKDAGQPGNDLRSIIEGKREENSEPLPIVGMKSMITVGGASRLKPASSLPILKWLLWSILALAVTIAGRMAYKLYREMSISRPENILK